jgi:hypothetical protein
MPSFPVTYVMLSALNVAPFLPGVEVMHERIPDARMLAISCTGYAVARRSIVAAIIAVG